MPFDVHAYIGQLSRFGLKPGLHRILGLLRHVGDPHLAFPALHIGGTNGKGSISAVVASILQEAGLKVGLFTSPHLIRYNERIQVNGRPISDEDLSLLMQRVRVAAQLVAQEDGHVGEDPDVANSATDVPNAEDRAPTEFEVGTAVAFLHFQQQSVDVAVVEVGLGGKLDSTNVLQTAGVALGHISLDHTAVLGNDLVSIAHEKAGIIKPGRPVVVSPQIPDVDQVIIEEAEKLSASVIRVVESGTDLDKHGYLHGHRGCMVSRYTPIKCDISGSRFHLDMPWQTLKDVATPLLGKHQIENAATAITLATSVTNHIEKGSNRVESGINVTVSENAIRQGLKKTTWPGRLEFRPGAPDYLLDGVHNLGGAHALADALSSLFPDKRIIFLVGILSEKDVDGILSTLLPFASNVVFTQPKSSRIPPIHPEHLASIATRLGFESVWEYDVKDAIHRAESLAGTHGMVCVCGSLYLIGEVMELRNN